MTSMSGHASIVGMLDVDAAVTAQSGRWAECVLRSASRTRKPVTVSIASPLLTAYRGEPSGFFRDDHLIVMIDGRIDNLGELPASGEASDVHGTLTEAALIARLFARHGVAIFTRFTGNFALVIVDQRSADVLLVRDRFGAKQLFYAATRTGWAWASEIKCLCPLLDRIALDAEGLRQAINYRYMVGDTLIEGVDQVLPASFVRIASGQKPAETEYWRLEFRPSQADGGLGYWVDRVDAGLDAYFGRLSHRYREVGVLLSGGVDSSLLALKAARAGFRSCVALTARWPGENPELEWAAAVARHIGIEHRIVDIDETYISESFPWLVWRMEEPPRHYNSFVLARLFEVASTQVEVLLNGHQADALFGPQQCISVNRFSRTQAQLKFIPAPIKRALASALAKQRGMRAARWSRYLRLDVHEYAKTLFRIHYGSQGERIFGDRLQPATPGRQAVERFYEPLDAATERLQRFDMYTFNESHLAVLDRLSAPFDMPVEMPFLSPELVDIALRLPSHLKSDGDVAKPVLKALAARSFPADWIYRNKQGFPTQTTRWLSGQLGYWRHLLTEERTAVRGILDREALRAATVGRDDEAIWTSMSLEMFSRQFIDGEGGPDAGPPTLRADDSSTADFRH